MADPIRNHWRRWPPPSAGEASPEEQAAQLFQRVPPEIPLSLFNLAKIRERWQTEVQQRHSSSRIHKGLVVGFFLFGNLSLAAVWHWKTSGAVAEFQKVGLHNRGQPPAPSRAAAQPPAPVEPPSPLAVVAPLPTSSPARTPVAAAPRRRSLDLAHESPLAQETALLGRALSQRREGHAAEALGTLRIYLERFPQGVLVAEAKALQIDLDISAGRQAEALQLFGSSSSGPQAPGHLLSSEANLTRAQLLAESAHCAEAVPLLESEMSQPLPAALEGQALLARARCRAQTGDAIGARRDLLFLVRSFPNSPAAEVAHRALNP